MTKPESVDAMIAWAKSRIEHCRREEAKFATGIADSKRGDLPQTLVEAGQERRTLQAVLEQIGIVQFLPDREHPTAHLPAGVVYSGTDDTLVPTWNLKTRGGWRRVEPGQWIPVEFEL